MKYTTPDRGPGGPASAFTPTYAEYIFLKGRRVLADQMEYLVAHFPRSSPLHERMQRWPM